MPAATGVAADTPSTQPGPRKASPEPGQDLPLSFDVKFEDNRQFAGIVALNWRYIAPYLNPKTSHNPIPTTGHVPDILALPRQRDIGWNPYRKNDFFERKPRDISAMLIYITGTLAKNACTRCVDHRGPFKGCVVIHKKATDSVRESITSCSNCFYHGTQTNCSLNPQSRYAPTQKDKLVLSQMQHRTSRDRSISASTDVPSSLSMPSMNERRRSGRLTAREILSEVTQQKIASTSSHPANARDQLSGGSLTSNVQARPNPAPSGVMTPIVTVDKQASPHLTPSSVEQPLSIDLTRMEDWEFAPGRIRSTNDPGDCESPFFVFLI